MLDELVWRSSSCSFADVVLEVGDDRLAGVAVLDALHGGGGEEAVEQRVLAEVLGGAAGERGAAAARFPGRARRSCRLSNASAAWADALLRRRGRCSRWTASEIGRGSR